MKKKGGSKDWTINDKKMNNHNTTNKIKIIHRIIQQDTNKEKTINDKNNHNNK